MAYADIMAKVNKFLILMVKYKNLHISQLPAQTVGEMSTGEQLSHVGGGKDLSLSSEPEVAVALA